MCLLATRISFSNSIQENVSIQIGPPLPSRHNHCWDQQWQIKQDCTRECELNTINNVLFRKVLIIISASEIFPPSTQFHSHNQSNTFIICKGNKDKHQKPTTFLTTYTTKLWVSTEQNSEYITPGNEIKKHNQTIKFKKNKLTILHIKIPIKIEESQCNFLVGVAWLAISHIIFPEKFKVEETVTEYRSWRMKNRNTKWNRWTIYT